MAAYRSLGQGHDRALIVDGSWDAPARHGAWAAQVRHRVHLEASGLDCGVGGSELAGLAQRRHRVDRYSAQGLVRLVPHGSVGDYVAGLAQGGVEGEVVALDLLGGRVVVRGASGGVNSSMSWNRSRSTAIVSARG